MKTTEAIRNGLNEENLGLVSGGADTGRVGPKDPGVVKAKGYIKESQELLGQAKDVIAPELDDTLKRAFNAIDKLRGFNISEAFILLRRAGPLVDLFVKRDSLRDVLRMNLSEARKILEPLI